MQSVHPEPRLSFPLHRVKQSVEIYIGRDVAMLLSAAEFALELLHLSTAGHLGNRTHLVDEQFTVQMVDLMLPNAGLQFGDRPFLQLAFDVVSLESDRPRPAYFREETWKTQAPFLALDGAPPLHDDRINVSLGLVALFRFEIHDKDLKGQGNLRTRKSQSFPFGHQIQHFGDIALDLFVDTRQRPSRAAQRRMRVVNDLHPGSATRVRNDSETNPFSLYGLRCRKLLAPTVREGDWPSP